MIADLRAEVGINGRIRVGGKGLILGGGNNAGRATGQSVFATLICEAATPFTERNTNLAGSAPGKEDQTHAGDQGYPTSRLPHGRVIGENLNDLKGSRPVWGISPAWVPS